MSDYASMRTDLADTLLRCLAHIRAAEEALQPLFVNDVARVPMMAAHLSLTHAKTSLQHVLTGLRAPMLHIAYEGQPSPRQIERGRIGDVAVDDCPHCVAEEGER